MFTIKTIKGIFQSRKQARLNQLKDKNTHLYQSLKTFPIVTWWDLLNNEISLLQLGLSDEKFKELYDVYFEEFDSMEWRNLLRLQAKMIREQYKTDLILELINYFKVVVDIKEIKLQEYAKSNLVEQIKKLFPQQKKINHFSSVYDIDLFLDQVYKSQLNILDTFKKEETKKKDKISVYRLISVISTNIGLKLNPNELTVLEFVNYYKLSKSKNE